MSSGVYITHDANRKQNREDLLDFITDLSPDETPIYQKLEKGKASNVYHEFLSYTTSRSTAISAGLEGDDYSFSVLDTPTRNINYVEEIPVTYKVSKTQALMDRVGGKELPFRRLDAMRKWKLKMEYDIIFGSGNSGASNTARVMKGILVSMTKATNASAQSITERRFNDYIQGVWNDVSDSTYSAYMDMRLKRDISSNFITSTVKNLEASDTNKLQTKIDTYESDVAKNILLYGHRELNGSSRLFIMQDRAWRLALLENPHDEDVASIGSYTAGVVRGSGTLEFLYPAAGINVTNLTPTA